MRSSNCTLNRSASSARSRRAPAPRRNRKRGNGSAKDETRDTLRVSEIANLKITGIDSTRVLIRVEQGKGHKDHYVMLARDLLDLLRQSW